MRILSEGGSRLRVERCQSPELRVESLREASGGGRVQGRERGDRVQDRARDENETRRRQVGLSVERGSGGRVEDRKRGGRWRRRSRKRAEVGFRFRVERGRGHSRV
eukprot:1432536-Rhodomonas_salina.1